MIVYSSANNTIVVDTQLPPLASLTRSKVNGWATSNITKVVITHWHPDHRSRSGGSEGLGFAVAINSARELVIDHRSFWSGFLGVLLPPDLARALNVPQTSGMLIQQIAAGSPAQAMGLRESDILIEVDGRPLMVGGDIILAANGVRLVSPDAVLQVRDAIRALPAGERLTIEILRQGQREMIEFVPAPDSQKKE